MRPTPTRRGLLAAPAAIVLAAALAACGGSDTPDGGTTGAAGGDDAFEAVTLEHAFGEAEITERPLRVVTWGWGSTDAAIALGVVPVGIPKMVYGADEEGYMPWTKEALDEAGGEMPTLLPDEGAPPFEQIDELEPDVILAQYSGITEADYDKLAQIAPTVAYPDQPWSTPWREVVSTTGQALGLTAEADELLEGIEAEVADAAAAHPQFEGKSIAAVAFDPTTYYVYTPADPRVEFLEDLGFTVASSVSELDTGEATFYYTLSGELVDGLTSDVLLSYSETEEDVQRQQSAPELQTMEQFRAGTVAFVVGESVISSVSPPTALSLTWGLDEFVAALAEAVAAAG
ncbi:iron-siderophore ABC transporter substrate-binding protein [Angustibacter speluncae]